MSRTRWVIWLVVIGLLLVLAPEPADPVAVEAFQTGGRLADEGRREEALAAYHKTIARRPRDPQPWRRLGELYATGGQLDAALHAYGQALRRGDGGAELEQGLAQLYARLGDYRRSARHRDTYLTAHPDDRTARLALAQTAIRLADWERARAELARLLNDDPNDVEAHAWLGLLLVGPDPMAGVPHLQRAADDPSMSKFLSPVFDAQQLSVASDDPAYRLALLGIAFLRLDVSPALAPATSTLALHALLGAVYHNPLYADAYAYLGQVLEQLGWSGWARASLQYALKLDPQSPVALTLMGLYWNRHDEPELARHYYETAYDQNRDNGILCLEIAATYIAQGNYTAAEAWLLIATNSAPGDPEMWEALSHFYLESGIGVEDSGLTAASRLLELAPDSARAHDLMGWAHFLTGEDEQAETRLRHALSLDPSLASAHYHLGRLYARQSRYAEAAQSYRQAEQHDVGGRWAAELERAWSELPRSYQKESRGRGLLTGAFSSTIPAIGR